MNTKVLSHYRNFGEFTYPGCYQKKLETLPDDIGEIAMLVRKQIIHPIVLGNPEIDFTHHGDMGKIPWYRQREEDNLPTVGAMLTELFRRDDRGLVKDREIEDKLVLSCRHVAILVASVLKSKDIPCRVRSGYAPYVGLSRGKEVDHWIDQYWDKSEKRWITFDVDACMEKLDFDPFDMPDGKFSFAAQSWLDVRKEKIKGDKFVHAAGYSGLSALVEALFFDFHCIMNNEIIYAHFPAYMYGRLNHASQGELAEIDELAELMLDPDDNFDQLVNIWKSKKKFRILKGGLL